MITMFQALYVFHIIIVLLWIVPHNRGGQLRAVLTNSSHEWFKVPDSCRLLTNERNIAHSPSVLTGLGWTKMSAKYLPWVEYLGCVRFRERKQLKATKTQVRKGEQLKECILYCTGYQFFGLQNLVCFCLLNFTLNDTFIESRCEINNVDRCFGDPFAFCGRESPGSFISVYQKVSIDAKHGFIGNCLAVNTRYQNDLKGWNCSTKFYQICRNSYSNTFTIGSRNKSNWKEAFNNCHPNSLASHISFKTNSNIGGYETFWLSNTRRWVTQKRDEGKLPEFCVAARIKQNGDVERILHKCSSPLPGLCIEIQNVPSNDLSKTSSPLPSATSFSSRLDKTSPPLPNTTFQGQTISTYSASLQSTYLSQLASTSSALKESIGTSTVVQATTFVGFPEYTSPDLLEFPPSDVPAKDELGVISAIVIIAIVAAFLIVIVILVTIILCKRKRKTQVPTSNEPLPMVGKEVVYAQVNKPTVKREKSTSSQKSQPTTSDDTYDHMEHCLLSQTHNPAESNYDTMRSIANADEEENNYDHATGKKMEPKRFVVDCATNYSHVEVEFCEVKDI